MQMKLHMTFLTTKLASQRLTWSCDIKNQFDLQNHVWPVSWNWDIADIGKIADQTLQSFNQAAGARADASILSVAYTCS